MHQLWVVKTAGQLEVKRSPSCTCCSVCRDGQKIFLYRLVIQKKKKNVLKPVRKCLKELKREVLWTMLHLTYCSSMEPALKTVSRSFWHRLVNPSAQPNGHSKQQYLLLSLIHSVVALIWSSQRRTISGGGTVGVHERSLISRNKSCLSLISTKRRKLCNNAAESTVKSFHIEM